MCIYIYIIYIFNIYFTIQYNRLIDIYIYIDPDDIYIYTYMTFLEFAGVSCSSGSPTRRLFVGIKKSKGDLDLDHGMIIYSFSFQRLYDHL